MNQMNTQNPLLCDPDSGVCELPVVDGEMAEVEKASEKNIKIMYFTDPICSSCWGIEPQLRKLKLEYGNEIQIDYHMGGLLPDWSYNSGGISKPSDVAGHWDEVSAYYKMPIDGDVWLEDPLSSSYPPSIAFKAAQIQNKKKALKFLRTIREMVFLEKKNICKWEHIKTAAIANGLDADKLKTDMDAEGKLSFESDLKLSRSLGVRGFPTLMFTDSTGKTEIIYGFRPYQQFEQTLKKLKSDISKQTYDKSAEGLFKLYSSLTLQEFMTLSEMSEVESLKTLSSLTEKKILSELKTKNGSLWRKIAE
ncbi:MAG TPA: DsbA family protein [Bacteroidia bacterium]